MTENVRSNLSRFQRTNPIVEVDNVLRANTERNLPPLMEDTRRTFIAAYEPSGSEVTLYLKAAAVPYTGQNGVHLLVVPDRKDHQDIPGIAALSVIQLQQTLQFAESVGRHTLQQPGIEEIDFGWHYAREGTKQPPKTLVASFPRNFHIHVAGFSNEDMRPLTSEEIQQSSYLTGITDEAIYPVIEQLLFNEVIPSVREQLPVIDDIFQEIKDVRGKRRLRVVTETAEFASPELAEVLKAMDLEGKIAYDEIAKCFFSYDESNSQFIKKDDAYNRFKLLRPDIRNQRLEKYIQQRPWLTRGIKLGLDRLAFFAKDGHQILSRELDKAKNTKDRELSQEEEERVIKDSADRFWTYRDFVYAMVFSAKKGVNLGPDWIFSYDPKVFTIGGITYSSAYTTKLINKDSTNAYTPGQLQAIQRKERQIINAILAEHPEYKIGPGIALNV